MEALCCLPPTLEPKATDHVTDMVATIEQIMSNGHGYDVDGDVFFDVASLPGYGRLSGRAQVVAACLHNSYHYMHFVHVMLVTYHMDLISVCMVVQIQLVQCHACLPGGCLFFLPEKHQASILGRLCARR